MTNTNDFRRQVYVSDVSNLINQFDSYSAPSYYKSSTAPQIKPQQEDEQNIKVRNNARPKKSRDVLKREQSLTFKKVVMIMASFLVVGGILGGLVTTYAMKNQLVREISSVQTEIADSQSVYVSLQSQLDALVSVATIEQYAVEELGMQKVTSNQIQYIDVKTFKAERIAALSATSSPDDIADDVLELTN